MQIVIAENGDGALAQAADEAQHFERFRAAVHKVADDPQRVTRRIECDPLEERPQLVIAALDIADGVGSHRAG
jgi:hypothetical protein